MFGKMAADALGLSDIGKIVSPKDYDKVDSDDYIMHEDNEEIYFLIKSKSDEYCFTNKALIHVDGLTAVSKKRTLYRYEYYKNRISRVSLETAGNIDLDVEIKFAIGEKYFSIDVDKKQLEELKDFYKSLIRISEIQSENLISMEMRKQSLQDAIGLLGKCRSVRGGNTSGAENTISLKDELKELAEYINEWNLRNREIFIIKDYGHIFERYINN